jgi:hypothetical protein
MKKSEFADLLCTGGSPPYLQKKTAQLSLTKNLLMQLTL